MPPIILWSPLEQFPFLSFVCTKCSIDLKVHMTSADWTCGPREIRLPRMLFCVNNNVLLISHVYQCTNGHEILGHHPDILSVFTSQNVGSAVPFVLWYQCGFTTSLCQYIHQLLTAGISLQKCESILTQNRLVQYHSTQQKICQLKRFTGIDQRCTESVLTKIPTRNAIKGCFLYQFEQFDLLYNKKNAPDVTRF